MIRIGFTGVPGSGKTSTARALVSRLRTIEVFKSVELVQEYARRYISKHGIPEQIWEQYRITCKQIEWEDSVSNDKLDILITDSPIFLGFMYATEMNKPTSKDIMVYNDVFNLMTRLNYPVPRYDLIFHLPPSITPVDDGIRAIHQLDQEWRISANQSILETMKIFKPKNIVSIAATNIDNRVIECINLLEHTWGR